MRKTCFFVFCFLMLVSSFWTLISSVCAVNPQGWIRKWGQQRGRRTYQKQTSVAAVRGIDEPSQIDPDARDFQSIESMERRIISPEKVIEFIKEGNLNESRPDGKSAQKSVEQDVAKIISQNAASKQMKEAVRPITTEEEIEIGKDVAANIAAQFGLVQNDTLADYVNLVGNAVSLSTPRKDIAYHFGVLDTDAINAYAAPGGYIFITKGLLKMLRNEAQLACILGHEISHVSQKHVIKEIQKSKIAQAVIPSHIKAAAQKSQWMSQLADLSIQLLWKGLSREDELEADQLGVEFAEKSGYAAQSYRDILDILKSKYEKGPESKELKFLVSSHPKPEERIQAVNKKLNSIPQKGVLLEDRFKKNAVL